MSTLALYEHFCPDQSGAHGHRQVTIVLHNGFCDHEALARSLARHLRVRPAPAKVVLFGLDSHGPFIEEALSHGSSFRTRLAAAWGAAAHQNLCFGIVLESKHLVFHSLGAQLDEAKIAAEVRLATTMTAQAIFIESKCMQIAPPGVHYSKTSKAHSVGFIRASNALVKSRHTLTLAYWLLPFVGQPARRILVDTSAIASLIYAACQVAVETGMRPAMPIIDSFQSYEGLSDADLEDVDNTLFVISASTSGNLARRAFTRGVDRRRLCTLYLLSQEQEDQEAVCQLRKHDHNPDGLDLLESWPEPQCPFCRKGSAAVQIGGDLFLTALPETDSVLLAKRHLLEHQRDIISLFAGLGVFCVYRRIGDRTAEISVDLAPAFQSPDASDGIMAFRQAWQHLLRRYAPANLTHIVYPTYPYAQELAQEVADFVSKHVQSAPALTSGSELLETATRSEGCAIVTTPCVHDPNEMMGINRDLRTTIPGGTATYLFPLVRAQSEAQAKGMITNITFGDRGAGTYSHHALHMLFLPEDRDISPWDRELDCIMVLLDWLETLDETVPPQLLARRKHLNEVTATGMVNTLFWPDCSEQALAIRSNFVLLPTEDGRRPLSQADIFVVVSALLNNLRLMEQGDTLRSSQYQHRILAPGNFVRFNDGIIQAALLRAARGSELNYVATDTERHSADMADHIEEMIRKASAQEGEALTEFILAIAMGTLRLADRDLESVISTVCSSAERVPPVVFLLARAIKAKVLPL
ncbi:hypothetical protein [Noviherbaspirillum malthae]|uniref:hypothetical protein n=1 Tax=Noviherbaspirillum malthae TaxID=1260987 RepID=UPI0018900B35|nr:hypothetical protein [Noviherbaspirillum malthae]